MNEISNLKKNFIVSIIMQIITISFSFIVPRLMISYYGAQLHGLTSVITGLISYLTLVEAGFGAASLQSLYKPLQERNEKIINGCLNEIAFFYKKIGIVFSILVILISFIYPFMAADNLSYIFVMSLIIVSGLAQTIEYFFCSKYRILLQADKKMYILNSINSIGTLLQGILRIGMILLKFDIILVQLIPAIVYICRLLLIKFYVKKVYRFLDGTIEPIKSVGNKKWNVLVHQIANLVVNNTDSLVLSTFVGYTSVSIYSIYSMIINNINGFISQSLSNAITANFGHLVNEENPKKINTIFTYYEKAINYIIIIIFSLVMALIIPFVKLYTESVTNIEYTNFVLAFLFVLNAILTNIRIPYLTIVNAKGLFKETQSHAILEALVNIIFSIIFVKYIGIYGVLIGTTLSYFVRDALFIWFINKKVINRSICVSLKNIFNTILILIVLFLINDFIIKYINIVSWYDWLIGGVSTTAVTLMIVGIYIILFDQNMLQLVKKILKIN